VGKTGPEAPVLFMKPRTAAAGPGESIVYPRGSEIVHFEGELVAGIGKTARHGGPREKRSPHVFGNTCGNDVSDRVVPRRESAFGVGDTVEVAIPAIGWLRNHVVAETLPV